MATTEAARRQCLAALDAAGIVLTQAERANLELADFALGDFEAEGLGVVVYENNARYCAKELVMLPGQTCPQHRHPPVQDQSGRVIDPGKQETFRCRQGCVWLYVQGDATTTPACQPPASSKMHYSMFREIKLLPGSQFTIPPDTLHWFQAGPQGAIISEFSSPSRDDLDVFTDPRIRRCS